MRILLSLVIVTIITSSIEAQIFNRKSKSEVPTFDVPRSLETRFDLSGGLILIPNEKEGEKRRSFLLDTGAPTLIINQLPNNRFSTMRVVGVNGTSSVSNKKIKGFEVQGMQIGNLQSYFTDLSSIEKIKNKKIEGILGFKVLKPFELFIDYERQYLMLFEKGASDLHTYIKPVDFFDISMKAHFPVIVVKIGKQKYYFGIDTGAEVNVINKKWERKICKQLKSTKERQTIQGLGANPVVVTSTCISELLIGKKEYKEMNFVFADLGSLNTVNGFELDGILGFPFLSSGKFSINYKDKKLYVWGDPIQEANALDRLSLLD